MSLLHRRKGQSDTKTVIDKKKKTIMLKAFESEEVMQRFTLRECGTVEAAQRKLAEVRKVFPGAFVVACRGTQIVK